MGRWQIKNVKKHHMEEKNKIQTVTKKDKGGMLKTCRM